ncbi:YkgJ family cysteine cluster protein [Saliphagus infecundisoli]|uniref:YkgJ family cysteine cluster protein n=1 Tax=Saliphagus infecundisoli TaxID=1849069 RepID=A0ABD5QJN9_9EURY|nr:YkgJ family cysteine cluster protein [Saliphagus infecundisoli]
MELNCAGCAGCCVDWRPLAPEGGSDHERRGPYSPLDAAYNLVALEREEIRGFLADGMGDALTVRLWEADDDEGAVEIDGHRLAAVAGRPAFFVGLRKPPKPVAPVGREEPTWLPSCVFLDPDTLQCRIHGDALYPAECGAYPAHNLELGVETECERVEAAGGGDRLLEDDPGDAADTGPLFGPQAVGQKLFAHPDPDDLEGIVERAAEGTLTREDRAEFVAVAAASSPGTLALSDPHYEDAREQVLAADSWAGRAIDDWEERAGGRGEPAATDPADAGRAVEEERGAPDTPGWD